MCCIRSIMFSICLRLGENLQSSRNYPDRTLREGRGEATLNRISSAEHTSPGTIVDVVRILLSFVSGTCTYRLVLPRFSFHDCTALVTPRCRIGGHAAQKCAARRYARHGNCVEAGNDSVRTNGRRGTDVKGTRRDGYPSLLILSLPLSLSLSSPSRAARATCRFSASRGEPKNIS